MFRFAAFNLTSAHLQPHIRTHITVQPHVPTVHPYRLIVYRHPSYRTSPKQPLAHSSWEHLSLFIYVPLFHYMGLIFDSLMLFFRIKCSNLIFFDIQMILEPNIFCQEVKKSINALMDSNIFIQESKILFFDLLWYRFHWRIPIWKIQIQMDSDAIYVEKTISESIWKIQIQMDSDAIYEEKTISESIWKIQIQMDSDNHFLIFQFLNHTVDGKILHHLWCPKFFFYGAEKWFSGVVGGAGFFPSTVLKKKIFKEIKKDLYGSIFQSIHSMKENLLKKIHPPFPSGSILPQFFENKKRTNRFWRDFSAS